MCLVLCAFFFAKGKVTKQKPSTIQSSLKAGEWKRGSVFLSHSIKHYTAVPKQRYKTSMKKSVHKQRDLRVFFKIFFQDEIFLKYKRYFAFFSSSVLHHVNRIFRSLISLQHTSQGKNKTRQQFTYELPLACFRVTG